MVSPKRIENGLFPSKARAELLDYFADFWNKEKLDTKSKTMKNLYSNAATERWIVD
jgi:hypothetical protein